MREPPNGHEWGQAGTVIAIATGGFALLVALVQFQLRVSPDVGWLLYAAGQVADGARLYTDVVEVNPPLAIAIHLPAVLGAPLLGLSSITLYYAQVFLLAAASLAVCWRVLQPLLPEHRARLPLMSALAFVALPLAWGDFGQREHVMLLLVLPYLLLAAVRWRGGATAPLVAAAVGLMAAVGISLKPHFVLVWAGVEAALLMRGRPLKARPEAFVVPAAGAVYVALVLMLTPEYFELASRFGPAYHDYLRNPFFVALAAGEGAPLVLASIVIAVGLRHATTADLGLRSVFTLAAVGMLLAAALQAKGWRYHYYPAMAAGVTLLALAVGTSSRPQTRLLRVYWAAGAGTLAVVIALTASWWLQRLPDPRSSAFDADPNLRELLEVTRTEAGEAGVMVFSNNIASAFPLLNYSGGAWGFRGPSVWPVAAVYHEQLGAAEPFRHRPPEQGHPLEAWTRDAVVEDLGRARPGVLLFLKPGPDLPAMSVRRIDYEAYFSADARFRVLLADYRPVGEVDEYRLWVRRDLAGGFDVSLAPTVPVAGGYAALPQQTQLTAAPIEWPAAAVFLVAFVAAYAAAGRRRPGPGTAIAGAA